jgi:hypothetical protein
MDSVDSLLSMIEAAPTEEEIRRIIAGISKDMDDHYKKMPSIGDVSLRTFKKWQKKNLELSTALDFYSSKLDRFL